MPSGAQTEASILGEDECFKSSKRCDQRKGSIPTVEFEGEPYRARVSFFLGNLQPGKGPGTDRDRPGKPSGCPHSTLTEWQRFVYGSSFSAALRRPPRPRCCTFQRRPASGCPLMRVSSTPSSARRYCLGPLSSGASSFIMRSNFTRWSGLRICMMRVLPVARRSSSCSCRLS